MSTSSLEKLNDDNNKSKTNYLFNYILSLFDDNQLPVILRYIRLNCANFYLSKNFLGANPGEMSIFHSRSCSFSLKLQLEPLLATT